MPDHTPWEEGFAVGHAAIDAEHKALLAQCDRLATLCEPAASDAAFAEAHERLVALVRAHRDTEAALLAARDYPGLEEHRDEFDEFEYVSGQIATAEHFDRTELQLFVARWCLGHIVGTAGPHRECLAGAPPRPASGAS